MIFAIFLTLSAALWRFLDGRGWGGRTTYRNIAGLVAALACATNSVVYQNSTNLIINAAALAGCAILAWATLVLGHTRWESWWSLFRYGGPTGVIAAISFFFAGLPPVVCAAYALGGVLAGLLYVAMHRPKDAPEDSWRAKDFKWNTAVCETVAGGVIVGGLSWLSIA